MSTSEITPLQLIATAYLPCALLVLGLAAAHAIVNIRTALAARATGESEAPGWHSVLLLVTLFAVLLLGVQAAMVIVHHNRVSLPQVAQYEGENPGDSTLRLALLARVQREGLLLVAPVAILAVGSAVRRYLQPRPPPPRRSLRQVAGRQSREVQNRQP
jgi:hypothetical protein